MVKKTKSTQLLVRKMLQDYYWNKGFNLYFCKNCGKMWTMRTDFFALDYYRSDFFSCCKNPHPLYVTRQYYPPFLGKIYNLTEVLSEQGLMQYLITKLQGR